MQLLIKAYQKDGVNFTNPKFIGEGFIHQSAYLDTVGKLIIGVNVVISMNVIILTHDYSYLNGLYAIGEKWRRGMKFDGPVIIEDNVFIGANVVVLPNCNIGMNSIIGAGAVVTKDVPCNSIVAGNPARVIGNTKKWIKDFINESSNKD